MAITAWSANVSSSAICCVGEWARRPRPRATLIAPRACPSAQQHRHLDAGCDSPRAERTLLRDAWERAGRSRVGVVPRAPRSARRIARAVKLSAVARSQSRSDPARRIGPRWPRWRVSRPRGRPSRIVHRRSAALTDHGGAEPLRTLDRWSRIPAGRPSASCEITRSTSAVAVCCSSASLSYTIALLKLLEEPGVLDGDDRLVGKRLQQGDLAIGPERAELRGAGRPARRWRGRGAAAARQRRLRCPAARARSPDPGDTRVRLDRRAMWTTARSPIARRPAVSGARGRSIGMQPASGLTRARSP